VRGAFFGMDSNGRRRTPFNGAATSGEQWHPRRRRVAYRSLAWFCGSKISRRDEGARIHPGSLFVSEVLPLLFLLGGLLSGSVTLKGFEEKS